MYGSGGGVLRGEKWRVKGRREGAEEGVGGAEHRLGQVLSCAVKGRGRGRGS